VWFRRLAYRQFLLASRTQYTLARRLTPAGKLAGAALVGAMIFGPNTRLTVSYQVFTLALAMLTVAALLSVRAPRGLETRRRLPRFGTVGEPLTYHVLVRNPGPEARAGLSLLEDLEDPRPDFATFVSTHEPDEARRNWFDRKVAYHRWAWLIEQNRRLEIAEHAVPTVPSRTTVEVRVTATPRRRGRARFRGVSVARPDPLGLVRAMRQHGKPIVREYQDEFFVRHGLVLDTFVPAPTPVFEEAVSVSASFAATVHTQDSLLDLMFVGPEAYVFTAGRGVGHVDRMLEVLAEVRPCPDRDFAALHRLVVERHSLLSGLVCVLVAWDDARRALVGHLRALGVPSLVLVVSEDAGLDAELETAGARRLVPGRIAEGLARL